MKVEAIAHYYIEHNKAGGEMFLHSLLRALAKEHEVWVRVTAGKKTENTVIDGVQVIYDRTKVGEPDVIISHFENTRKAKQKAWRKKIPHVTIVHNDARQTRIMAKQSRSTDLLAFNSEWIAKKTPARAKKFVINPPIFSPKKQEGGEKEFITLVNITGPKGASTFYKMAENLSREKFLAVEGGYWKNIAVKKDLPNITHIPQTGDMWGDVYAKTKVLLMPSKYESYGMCAAEAAAWGIPVICHPTPGLKENLGDSGIFINRTNYQAWYDEIEKLNDSIYYKERSEKILERSKSKTPKEDLQKFVEKIESLA